MVIFVVSNFFSWHCLIPWSYNLSDVQDINFKLCNMVRKANCLFASFPRVGQDIFFQSYCPSQHGSGLWLLSSPALQNIEVAFNKILRRIWSLPLRSHSRIAHLVANLHSLFNVIYRCSILPPPSAVLCLFVPSSMIPPSSGSYQPQNVSYYQWLSGTIPTNVRYISYIVGIHETVRYWNVIIHNLYQVWLE